MLLQLEHQKVSLKEKRRGERGIIYCCPRLPTQRVQHGVEARPGCCRPAEFHAPDIERTQLSPGAVEGLELVPPPRDGQGEAPRAPAAWELGRAGFTAGPT